MPGLFRSKKQSKEAKKRFQHLMVIAQGNPNKVFDLTSCELSAVPSSVFEQCRVFLTESLLLHTNMIKSLNGGGILSDLSNLRVLDLHENVISHLPENIGALSNLQILNVENNKLTVFPSSLGNLKKLQSLLARDNFLNCLPQTVGKLSSLRTLDISGTNQVFYLPKTFCHIQTLEVLLLAKPHCMEYPPPMVASEGLEAMQKFICKDVGVTYVPPSHQVLKVLDQTDGAASSTSSAVAIALENESLTNIQLYEKQKEERRTQLLELERQMAENQAKLAMMSAQDKEAKQKDYINMQKEFQSLDKKIQEQQEEKDKERRELFNQLKRAETEASDLVSQLLNATEKARKQEELLEEMERQRLREEEYFKVTQNDIENLRKQETLAAMQSMLASDDQCKLVVQKYLEEQEQARLLAQQSMGEDTEKLQAELKRQQSTQNVLVQKILDEERLQKEAFALLQFQRDAIQMRLMSQINQLQDELIRLTKVEAQKKAMKMEVEQETLRLVREDLTDLMMQLLKEKDQREEMLKERLVEMEQQRENDQVDFWLVQYQRLLDSKPQVLLQKEEGLDDDVINLLRLADAAHHVPHFVRHKVTANNVIYLNDQQLQSIGVFEIGLRHNILREIENLIARRKKIDVDVPPTKDIPTSSTPGAPLPSLNKPSATPSAPLVLPSAPAPEEGKEIENECVVCLDRESDSVFLPCGHVCCCYQCSINLNACPMCRAKITQKIRMFRS